MGVKVDFNKVYELDESESRTRYKPKRYAVSWRIRFQIFQRDDFKCVYCGAAPPDTVLQIDHRVAVANGGSNELENLATACYECNMGKGAEALN